MDTSLTFRYDREADILHIDKCAPYAAQESEELGDEIIARINPRTGEVENPKCASFPRACSGRSSLSCRWQPICASPGSRAPDAGTLLACRAGQRFAGRWPSPE